MTSILGISAFYHDSAAAIVIDGKIVAAAQEERFSRIKHDSNFPDNAVKFVLKYSNLKLSEVDHIVFYEKPFLKFERLLETYVAFAPKGFIQFTKAMPLWMKEKLFQKKLLIDYLKVIDGNFKDEKKVFFSEHHMSHAASAFFPSPFNEAIILTADGVGEWATSTVAIGKNNNVEIKKEIHFPHSLGLLYSAFTYYTGFKVNSGEYKLMGLAPYGEPKYINQIKDNLIDLKDDGSFRLNQDYFNYDQMQGSYLGPEYSQIEIEKKLNEIGANYNVMNEEDLLNKTAEDLSKGKAIGWFQGRMEFGPRALGARSILADPRSDKMQKELNLKVKFRESFRPFAPSVLREDVNNWFDLDIDSPYMLLVSNIKKNKQIPMSKKDQDLFGIDKLNIKRSSIPAVTHIDYSARIQTVHNETNPKYYKLIKRFKEVTDCPVLVNTSFNVRGEPIVCTIEDAYKCFMGTNLDILVCENFILYKKDQPKDLLKDYKSKFELD